jgi:hypothetical protein
MIKDLVRLQRPKVIAAAQGDCRGGLQRATDRWYSGAGTNT